MSTYPVRVFGDPVLKQKAKDVTDIDGQLSRFVDTMVDTMYEAAGVGLAAPQVGVQKRMFTFDAGEGPAPEVLADERDEQGRTHYDRVREFYRTHEVRDYDVARFYDRQADRLSDLFYKGDRSMRESGFDP